MTEQSDNERFNGLLQERLLSTRINNTNIPFNCAVHSPYCTTCQHVMMSEEVARGLQLNGHISAVRRFFCLFVTFDFLFTSLLWLICLVLAGDFNFTTAFYKEIVHYGIRTSLFDVVMASLTRFVVLELFYGLLQIDHWIIVAFSTVATCCFSVFKVYMFDWSSSPQVLSVMLIISSFILSWGEVWLLDIKVIPQERSALQYLTGMANPDERSPLIRSFLHSHTPFDLMSDSIGGTFYSPVESPQGSDDEKEDSPVKAKDLPDLSPYMTDAKSSELLEKVWEILTNDKWELESKSSQGDEICSQKLPKGEKVFRLVGVVDAPLSLVLEVLYKRLDEFPLWNPTVKESRVLQKLNRRTDVIYQRSGVVGKGLVSSRDFVMLRCLAEKNGYQLILSESIPNCGQCGKSNVVRGENGPGCWALKEVAAFETEVMWLLNTNIRGWLPQYAVDSATSSVMTDNMATLRRRLATFRESATA